MIFTQNKIESSHPRTQKKNYKVKITYRIVTTESCYYFIEFC